MLDSPDIKLANPRTHGYEKMIKDLISQGDTEPAARNKIAGGLRTLRSTPISNKLFGEQRRTLREVQKQSLIDPLTGLFNRRHLDGDGPDTVLGIGEFRREFDEALRSQHDLSLLMIDIDDFKNYNDTYGHPEGDRALKTIADTIRRAIRDTDLPFRFGGEELLVLLPEANLKSAGIAAERLREVIEKIQTLKRQVTVSIGVSAFHNSKEWKEKIFSQNVKTKDQLLQLADDALYFSKKEGKNRITAGNNLTQEQISQMEQLRKKGKDSD